MIDSNLTSISSVSQSPRATDKPSAQNLVNDSALAQLSGKRAFSGFEPLSAERAASNILGFIERQIDRDIANGADQAALESRLEAGLKGFKQGFAEAEEKLKALNMLNPTVRQDIDKTYDLVTSGIAELGAKVGVSTQASTDDTVSLSDAAPSSFRVRAEYASAEQFEFRVRTQEGDWVSVSASSSAAQGLNAEGNGEGSSLSYAQSSSSRYSISVEGDLNERERKAIESLMGQVDQLADEFFTGDLDQAFEYARSLGYDDSQISGFALQLTRTEYQRVDAAYQGSDRPDSLASRLAPLGDFIEQTRKAVDTASEFAEPIELIRSLVDSMYADIDRPENPDGQRFTQFLDRVLNQTAQMLNPAPVEGE